jgi:hypothetical protein
MIFCERCKTYHEPGGPELCAPPYPSGNEKMIRNVTIPKAREVTLDLFGFEKRIRLSTDTRRVRIPAFLGPHFPDVRYIEFEQDEGNENLFRLSHVHRTGDCPACAKPDTGTD